MWYHGFKLQVGWCMIAPTYRPAYVEENLASRLQFSLFTTTSRIYNTNLSSKNAWFMIPYDLDDAVVIEFGWEFKMCKRKWWTNTPLAYRRYIVVHRFSCHIANFLVTFGISLAKLMSNQTDVYSCLNSFFFLFSFFFLILFIYLFVMRNPSI